MAAGQAGRDRRRRHPARRRRAAVAVAGTRAGGRAAAVRGPAAGRAGLGPPGAGPAAGGLPGIRLELAVIEDTAPMDAVRLGSRGPRRAASPGCTTRSGRWAARIGSLCYNWRAVTRWALTHHDVLLRGGAGPASTTTHHAAGGPGGRARQHQHDQLWAATSTPAAVVPVAQEAGVRHRLSRTIRRCPRSRGVPRITRTPAALTGRDQAERVQRDHRVQGDSTW